MAVIVDKNKYAALVGAKDSGVIESSRQRSRSHSVWGDNKGMTALLEADRDSSKLKRAVRTGIPDELRGTETLKALLNWE
jgi:hypothetical protein